MTNWNCGQKNVYIHQVLNTVYERFGNVYCYIQSYETMKYIYHGNINNIPQYVFDNFKMIEYTFDYQTQTLEIGAI